MPRKVKVQAIVDPSYANEMRNSSGRTAPILVDQTQKLGTPGNKKLRAVLMHQSVATGMNLAKSAMMKNSKARAGLANSIAAAIMLPHEFPAIRLADVWSSVPTAVANPFTTFTIDNTTVNAATKPFWSGAVFRDVQRALIVFYMSIANGQGAAVYGNALFSSNGGTTQGVSTSVNIPICAGVYHVPMCHFPYSSGTQLHGPVLYCGVHQERKGVWLNNGDAITFTFSYTTNGEVQPYLLIGETWGLVTAKVAAVASTTTITAGTTGYYAFDIEWSNAASTSTCVISATSITTATTAVFAHLCVGNVSNKAANLTGVRVSGVSFLLQNASAILNSSGTVAACPFASGTPIVTAIQGGINADPTVSSYGYIVSQERSWSNTWDTGAYGYLKPTNAEDFAMKFPFRYDSATTTMLDCTFELVPSGYVAFAVSTQVSSSSSTLYPANYSQITICHALEYQTNDVWVQQISAGASEREFEVALQLVKMAPQFFENPLHFSDIVAFLKKAGKKALDIAPEALEALAGLLPETMPMALPLSMAARAFRAHRASYAV